MAKTNRWEKESRDFIEALTGGTDITLKKKNADTGRETPDQRRRRERLEHLQRTSGGRPRNGSPVTDPLVVYNFKIRQSELDRLKELSGEHTRTMRDLLSEAVADLLDKYAK